VPALAGAPFVLEPSHAMPERKVRSSPASGKADPDQFARFAEAARELGCEENFERFEEALPRVLRAPPAPLKPKAGAGKKGRPAD
jgi:hypothetical protein